MSEVKDSPPSTQSKGEADASANKENVAVKEKGEADKEHGLQHRWTLYYNGPKMSSKGGGSKNFKDADWNAGRKRVAQFEDVEAFWTLFNNLVPPSQLMSGSKFHLFKGDVRPEWEDAFNEKGGSWSIKMNRTDGATPKQLDDAWLRTVMFMVGDNFHASDDICGIVCLLRKTNRLELWTRTADNEAIQMQIGEQFKQCLKEAGIDGRLTYKRHSDSLNAGKGNRSSALYEI